MNLEVLSLVAAIIAAFGSQIYLVKRLVAFVKEVSGLKGNAARIVSFLVGAVIGSPIFWAFLENNPGMSLASYVLMGVLFIPAAGLIASGDYDLSQDKA